MRISGSLGRIRVMGVINVSPESFYKQSIKTSAREIARTAREMAEQGADLLDIGAMSTAPYLKTVIPPEEEAARLRHAIKAVRDACGLPVSVDTPRARVADAALNLGAEVVNDVTGLKYDPDMGRVVADHGASLIVSAYEKRTVSGDPVRTTINSLKASIRLAREAGIRSDSIAVDPAIGFFRSKGNHPFFTRMKSTTWLERDLLLLRNLSRLHALRKPVCVSVSRKSFIGRVLGIEEPEERLLGSIAAEAICVLNGAHLIRTHNVAATIQAVRMAEAVLRG